MDNPHFQFKKETDTEKWELFHTILVSNEHAHELTQTLDKIANNKDLSWLLDKIRCLSGKSEVNDKVVDAFRKFFGRLCNESVDLISGPYPTIIQHVAQEAANVFYNPNRGYKEIGNSFEQLDEALHGKQPMSPKVKAAICGVIGALVGFAIGIVVGAAITAWGGGFGALPGAIAGAFLGFTVATTVGIGGAGLGALAGGVSGFFNAKENIKKFKSEKHVTFKTETKELYVDIGVIDYEKRHGLEL